MLTKLCSRCRKPVKYPYRYCQVCQDIVIKQREQAKAAGKREYGRRRVRKHLDFYNSKEWKMLRGYKMQQAGYKCESCGSFAEDVHHIVTLDEDKSKGLELENLMCLCVKCHNEKHDRYQRKHRGPGVGNKV